MKNGTIEQLLDVLQLGLKLRPEQERAIEALEWLYDDDNARSGRTTALAVFHLKRAMDKPRTGVVLFDHYGGRAGSGTGRAGQRSVEYALKALLEQHKGGLCDRFSLRHGILTYFPGGKRNRVDIAYKTSTSDFELPPKLHLDFSGARTGRLRCDRPNQSNGPKSASGLSNHNED